MAELLLRRDAWRLLELSNQAGLSIEQAQEALVIGARILAHGFTTSDLDDMIRGQYERWRDQDRRVETGSAPLWERREYIKRHAND